MCEPSLQQAPCYHAVASNQTSRNSQLFLTQFLTRLKLTTFVDFITDVIVLKQKWPVQLAAEPFATHLWLRGVEVDGWRQDGGSRGGRVALSPVLRPQRPYRGVSKSVRLRALWLKEVWRRVRCAITAPEFSQLFFIFKVTGCCFGAG